MPRANSTLPQPVFTAPGRAGAYDFRDKPAGKFLHTAGLVLLLIIGVARITSTYHVFNHTIDEGSHVACGVQWFEKGVYQYDHIDTPLPRLVVAILPYLSGIRGYGKSNYWEEGALELATGGRYWHTLTLARIAVVPFFILATVIVFVWSRRIYGYPAALVSAAFFTMMPVVLAHSAIAATDIIFTSFFLTAVFTFTRWLAKPSLSSAVLFGCATGLSAASKFSTLVYLPATIIFTLILYFAPKHPSANTEETSQLRRWGPRSVFGVVRTGAVVLVCAFLVIWAAYRFSHAPLSELSSTPEKVASKIFGAGSSPVSAVHAVSARLPIPAPEYYDGLRFLRDQNKLGRRSYMFGRIKDGGWWYFYIVSLGLKTPLAGLILAILGSVSLLAYWFRERTDWQSLVPLVGTIAILLATLPSRINIGVRHVMPIFAFLSMLGGYAIVQVWKGTLFARRTSTKSPTTVWVGRFVAVLLALWFALSSALSHPDYLAYFNEFGGRNPANLLVISDLDWGQDLTRLASYLRDQQAQKVSVLYVVPFEPNSLGLPKGVQLHCGESATGWVGIEERYARTYPECVKWLDGQPIRAYVGKSMRVYYVPEANTGTQ